MKLVMPLLVAWTWLMIAPAAGYAIDFQVGKERMGGFLISEEKGKMTIKVVYPSGWSETKPFERKLVKINHEVDRQRLEKLSKDNPKSYQELAEDLARHRQDPEAMDYARRLFLIAAYLDPGKLGPDCLVAMANITSDPVEARRLRAWSYIHARKKDQLLLERDAPTSAPKSSKSEGLERLGQALRFYSMGQFKQAKEALKQAKQEEIDFYFRSAGALTRRDFNEACRNSLSSKDYEADVLAGVIRLQIWVDDRLHAASAGAAANAESDSWSKALNIGQRDAAPPLTLETITDFDPRACVYRGGKWVVP